MSTRDILSLELEFPKITFSNVGSSLNFIMHLQTLLSAGHVAYALNMWPYKRVPQLLNPKP